MLAFSPTEPGFIILLVEEAILILIFAYIVYLIWRTEDGTPMVERTDNPFPIERLGMKALQPPADVTLMKDGKPYKEGQA